MLRTDSLNSKQRAIHVSEYLKTNLCLKINLKNDK